MKWHSASTTVTNAYLFRDTLLRLIGSKNLPYAQLVG